jgi:hypothetical protein
VEKPNSFTWACGVTEDGKFDPARLAIDRAFAMISLDEMVFRYRRLLLARDDKRRKGS